MSRSFFVKKEDINKDIIQIKNDEYLHLKVLRKQVGDNIKVCNNTDDIFDCKIISIDKNMASAKIINIEKSEKELNNKLCLCFALSKADKMEFVLQKATELGITQFIPFSSEFTTVKENTTKLDRLEKISLEACKQCGGAKAPKILPITKLKELPLLLKNYDKILLAYENSKTKFDENLKNQNVALIVGSEGGFSQNEVDFLKTSMENLEVISLGKRILRAETAGIVLTTLALEKMGEI